MTRILCVADEFPWPPTSGYRIRLMTMLAGLAEVGDIDLFCSIAERPDVAEGEHPTPPGIARLYVHRRDRFRPTLNGFVRWSLSRLPRAVAWIDWCGAHGTLQSWAPSHYDLVWFSHCHTWAGVPRPAGEATIVDFDNLEDEKLRSLVALRRRRVLEGSIRATLRTRLGTLLDRLDIGRWRRLQQRAAARSRAVVVCSEADRARLRAANPIVVPNGFAGDAVERVAGAAPVFTMVGLMTYPPNEDGARFFATQVLPLVRATEADAIFRIVGRDDGLLVDLDSVPGVERTGEVADVGRLLSDTTAVVVPLRAGSGTRVKILEAFAGGLPVISTTLGCEGLDVRDGVELLIADPPGRLAEACLTVLREPDTASTIAAAGHALWEARYRPATIEAQVAAAARSVMR
jgi:polysaccharide biosynthesis protein PslH